MFESLGIDYDDALDGVSVYLEDETYHDKDDNTECYNYIIPAIVSILIHTRSHTKGCKRIERMD